MCGVSTFAAVYLGALGYSNTELGRIIAIGALIGFLMPMVISPTIDRSKKINASMALLAFQTVGVVLGLLIFLISQKNGWLSILYVLWVGVMLTTSSLMPQICQDYLHEGWDIDFGFSRAFGSLMFVGMSAGLGKLLEMVPKTILPLSAILMEVLMMTMVVVLYFVSGKKGFTKNVPAQRPEEENGEVKKEESSDLRTFLRENRGFTLLLFAIGLIFSAAEFFGVYMINIVENVGGTSADMGSILAVCAAAEIPSMVLWGKISTWKYSDLLLGLCLFCFTIRELIFGLATSLPPLYFAALFQMLGYGLYTPAIVDYIRKHIPYKDSVKAQSLVVAMNTFGMVFSSLMGGILVDHIGVRPTLFILTGVSLMGSCLGMCAVLRNRKTQNSQ